MRDPAYVSAFLAGMPAMVAAVPDLVARLTTAYEVEDDSPDSLIGIDSADHFLKSV